ncbi:MAG: ABC transporter substrate-binding protein [Candidatus Dormibacteria bacterium]
MKVALVRPVLVAAMAAVLVSACSSATPHPATKASGGVVTYAELPQTPPNYILPLESGVYLDDNNAGQFSRIMYLPLYWFGNQGQPSLNRKLSIALPPVFSDHNTQVTVTLKHWMWSNGKPITARDVIFWMNLLSAVTDPNAPVLGSSSAPGPGWGEFSPGGFPENVVSYRQTGTYTLVLHLNASYNPTWFLDNNLSQIYPLPTSAWDRLSLSGSVGNYDASAQSRILLPTSASQPCTDCYISRHPGTATSGALAVAQFLNVQSQDLTTYASNPLWQVVDGPFHLTQFTTSGFVKMVPNRSYSGSPKPRISAFEELPFTSDSAEYAALNQGSLTIGYIPPQDLSQRAALESRHGYKYAPWYVFGVNVSPYNFTNPTAGPMFQQLYFRQAVQTLVNQAQYIKVFADGQGSIADGPVPTYPPNNPDVSPLERSGKVYPYSPGTAVHLLSEHGWTVHPGGTSVCAKPGSAANQCGPGVKLNQPAAFNLLYDSGSTQLTNEMETLQSTLKAKAGISVTLSQGSFSEVIGKAFTNCSFSAPCPGWDVVDWGVSATWTYTGALPTGGVFFSPGAVNAGDYVSQQNNANIQATHTAPNQKAELAALYRYQDYVAKQLPFLYLPNGPFQLTMYKSNLQGLLPQGVFTELYPQSYSFGS